MAEVAKTKIGSVTLDLVQGDITRQEVDAIVNAANSAINENQPDFELVRFVLFDAKALRVFSKALATLIAERDDVEPA